ncbi:PH domain-containing protein [uncultured Umboniibacter sp.]|uniref:PH domain-containing protein n=1 Tax=uncultured Umboniibacter sp. TaxID=1798917 RepID=UPI00262C7E42|nr:PH domain-containing protein [uncultured Umboniibacter sp.]
MKFPSAVAPWFYLLAIVLPIAVIVYVVVKTESTDAVTIGIVAIVTVSAVGLPIWLILSTYYLVEGETLNIRSGPMKVSIPLGDIHSVTPSRSMLSAPALSLKRLKIGYGKGKTILVSPKDVEGFKSAIGQQGS